jgi:hypothetical protein
MRVSCRHPKVSMTALTQLQVTRYHRAVIHAFQRKSILAIATAYSWKLFTFNCLLVFAYLDIIGPIFIEKGVINK